MDDEGDDDGLVSPLSSHRERGEELSKLVHGEVSEMMLQIKYRHAIQTISHQS